MEAKFDPILVEVVKHELVAVAEEMAIAISKTGRSAMVKMGDFGVAICDARGRVMGPGYASPFAMVNFIEMMRQLYAKWEGTFEPGDIVISNDPFAGAGHMPDIAVVAPVFWQGRLSAFTIVYSHHTDIGGRFAGGISSQATSSYEEGIRIPTVKVCRGGVRNEALMATLMANVRASEDFLGDLEAKMSGCWRGEKGIIALLDKYGAEGLESCGRYLDDYSERVARDTIRAIPDGQYVAEDYFDDDGFGRAVKLPLKVTLIVEGDRLKLDFAGTAPQALGAINVPLGMSKAMAVGALKMIVGPEMMINEGYLRPIQINVPSGTLLNPEFPRSVGGRAPLMFRVSDLVLRALALALPDRVPVTSEGGDVLHFAGKRADGTDFALMDIFSGGWGARPRKDGIDGVMPMIIGNYATIPAELIEREYPIVVEAFGLVPDSDGAGKYRGSLGVYRQWRFLRAGQVMVRTTRPGRASEGLAGGRSGKIAANVLNPEAGSRQLPQQTHLHLEVNPGDVLYHATPGSGGHGHPYERSTQMVLEDVRDEKVSLTRALADYGVVIDSKGISVDEAATRAKRDALRNGSVREHA